MKFHLKRKKPGEKLKTALKTSDPYLVHEIVMKAISEKEKKGLKIEGDVVINVEGKNPDAYLLVENGQENKRQGVRFVGTFF